MDVYIVGKRVRVSPRNAIGKGGEADVYDIGNGQALKVWKAPDHPDFKGVAGLEHEARSRIRENQHKLKAFPGRLSPKVLGPAELATDKGGKRVMGYTMRRLDNSEVMLRLSERAYRANGIGNAVVVRIFCDLHQTVCATHRAGVVIGDFNDLNVLVADNEAYLIDTDSFQFDKYLCNVFTTKFVDPLHCNPADTKPVLCKPHSTDSDWYAFAIMLMQSLLFVGPYGGVYRPAQAKRRVPHDARPLHRITVFHPDVRYPKPAIPYESLPDDLLHWFHLVFETDRRGVFPIDVIGGLTWQQCRSCGIEHARTACPQCVHATPVPAIQAGAVRGRVEVRPLFETGGMILATAVQNGRLGWLYHDERGFHREDGTMVFAGQLDPNMQLRLCGAATLAAKAGRMIVVCPNRPTLSLAVDQLGSRQLFDANERHSYRVENGRLLRDETLGAVPIGNVLAGQTMFWVGPRFGFGFYRAGELSVGFVFEALGRGINDSIKLPPMRGQLVDAACVLTADRCWLLTATVEQGRRIHRCTLLMSDGTVAASYETQQRDGDWLATLQGKCAVGDQLFTATDDGIVRIEPHGDKLIVAKTFPDTEPFVEAGCQLVVGNEGLVVVGRSRIDLITMAS